MNPAWWSQPFAQEGSAAAEGIVNQLGRPALRDLTVLVREAAQNSWDASSGNHDVAFTVNISRLRAGSSIWRELLLPGPGGPIAADLAGCLQDDSVIITISDRYTRGLGGPLRAGVKPKDGERNDFVQFLRNVGEARDHEYGGGTYGFGKGIFYRLSQCASILVDSFTADGTEHERRLMGASLGGSFYDSTDRRFTGRHWWGVSPDGIPDPVLGSAAASIAEILELPGFADGIPGTDIVIIGARLDEAEPGQLPSDIHDRMRNAAEFIASSILWNLWPKMISDQGKPRMIFEVAVEGVSINLPKPEDHQELSPFADALSELRSGTSVKYSRSKAPIIAGELSVVLAPNLSEAESAAFSSARPFEGPSRHIARMRVAELVVDYFPGPPPPDELLRYGGVFRTVKESDAFFAEAEPPTHDDWIHLGLQGVSRGVVSNSKAFITRELAKRFGTFLPSSSKGMSGLGQLASRLSKLSPSIDGGSGASAATSRPGRGGNSTGSGGGGRGSVRPRIVEPARLMLLGEALYIVARVRIPGTLVSRVEATATVILDGGQREMVSLAGADRPVVIQWQPVAGGPAVHGTTISPTSRDDTEWWIYATFVPDVVTRIEVRVVNDEL